MRERERLLRILGHYTDTDEHEHSWRQFTKEAARQSKVHHRINQFLPLKTHHLSSSIDTSNKRSSTKCSQFSISQFSRADGLPLQTGKKPHFLWWRRMGAHSFCNSRSRLPLIGCSFTTPFSHLCTQKEFKSLNLCLCRLSNLSASLFSPSSPLLSSVSH